MDDSPLRDSIKEGCFTLENGLKFAQPNKGKNICFVSQWDNYPTRTEIPVDEAGKELYVLFAELHRSAAVWRGERCVGSSI